MTHAYQLLWVVLYSALLVVSVLCLSALYNRAGTSWLTRLAYAVMPIGSGLAVSGLINGEAMAVELGQVTITVGMLLWSLRILHFLTHNGTSKQRKQRAYEGKRRSA